MTHLLTNIPCLDKNADGSYKIVANVPGLDWDWKKNIDVRCTCPGVEHDDSSEPTKLIILGTEIHMTDHKGRRWFFELRAYVRSEECRCNCGELDDDHQVIAFDEEWNGDYMSYRPGYAIVTACVNDNDKHYRVAPSSFGRITNEFSDLKEKLQSIHYMQKCATCDKYTNGLLGTCKDCRNKKALFGDMPSPKDPDKICSICQDDALGMEHRIITTPCKHRFHRCCLLKARAAFFESRGELEGKRLPFCCPLCRNDLTGGIDLK